MKVFELRNLIHKIFIQLLSEGRPLGSKNKPKTVAPVVSFRNNILVTTIGKWVAKNQKQEISQTLQAFFQEITPKVGNLTFEVAEERLSQAIKQGNFDLSFFLQNPTFGDWFGSYLERVFDLEFLDVSYDTSRRIDLEIREGSLTAWCHFIGSQIDPDVDTPNPNEIKNSAMDKMLSDRGAQDVRVEWELRKYNHNDYYFYIDYDVRFRLVWDSGQEFSKLLDPDLIRNEFSKFIHSKK